MSLPAGISNAWSCSSLHMGVQHVEEVSASLDEEAMRQELEDTMSGMQKG